MLYYIPSWQVCIYAYVHMHYMRMYFPVCLCAYVCTSWLRWYYLRELPTNVCLSSLQNQPGIFHMAKLLRDDDEAIATVMQVITRALNTNPYRDLTLNLSSERDICRLGGHNHMNPDLYPNTYTQRSNLKWGGSRRGLGDILAGESSDEENDDNTQLDGALPSPVTLLHSLTYLRTARTRMSSHGDIHIPSS